MDRRNEFRKMIEDCMASQNPQLSLKLLLAGMEVELGKEATIKAIKYHYLNRFGFYTDRNEKLVFEKIREINETQDFFPLRSLLDGTDVNTLKTIEKSYLDKIKNDEFWRMWEDGTLYK